MYTQVAAVCISYMHYNWAVWVAIAVVVFGVVALAHVKLTVNR